MIGKKVWGAPMPQWVLIRGALYLRGALILVNNIFLWSIDSHFAQDLI